MNVCRREPVWNGLPAILGNITLEVLIDGKKSE